MRSMELVVAVSFLLLTTTSCAIFESVGSISDSVSTGFGSSSDSISSSSGEDTAYRQDVSELTLAFATRGGDLDAFRGDVGTLAEQRGITSWEDDASTCSSIGAGVRRAQLDGSAALQFGDRLFGENPPALAAYRTGYTALQ